MLGQTNVWIVRLGLRSRKQNQSRLQTSRFVCAANQFPSDALALTGFINGKVGQISAVTEIGDGSRNANQPPFLTGRKNNVRMGEHLLNRLSI